MSDEFEVIKKKGEKCLYSEAVCLMNQGPTTELTENNKVCLMNQAPTDESSTYNRKARNAKK